MGRTGNQVKNELAKVKWQMCLLLKVASPKTSAREATDKPQGGREKVQVIAHK